LLRLDGIAFTGAEITPYYDSLLGKASSVASLEQVINYNNFLHFCCVKISLYFFRVYLSISAEVKSTANRSVYRESELSESSEFFPELLFQSTKKVYDVILIELRF
jgi:hypothetical protein